MLIRILVRWAVLAVAFAITGAVLSGMDISGGFFGYLWVALLFGLVNAVVGTLLRLVTLPLMVLTFGLFSIVVNALLLELTDALTSDLQIDDFFWTAIGAAVILAVVSVAVELVLSLVFRPDAVKSAAAG